MSDIPQPPYLSIREGVAFGVETQPITELTAYRQAFEEGCFQNTSFYDGSGRLWPVLTATISTDPIEGPPKGWWRRLLGPPPEFRVSLEVGPPRSVTVQEVISRLAKILLTDSEFSEDLPVPAAEILKRFEAARTPHEIISVAQRVYSH